jgi:hypothetical protein
MFLAEVRKNPRNKIFRMCTSSLTLLDFLACSERFPNLI